jgi:hypothetical protein
MGAYQSRIIWLAGVIYHSFSVEDKMLTMISKTLFHCLNYWGVVRQTHSTGMYSAYNSRHALFTHSHSFFPPSSKVLDTRQPSLNSSPYRFMQQPRFHVFWSDTLPTKPVSAVSLLFYVMAQLSLGISLL